MRGAWIEIHLEAIRKNIRFLKSRISPSTKFMGVVKADAYGHGAVPVARILEQEGTDQFAVAIAQEGVELRQAGFHQPILVLGRVFEDDYSLIFQYDLTPAVFSIDQAESLNNAAQKLGKILPVHLKVDTGMGRLGFLANAPETVDSILHIAKLPNLRAEGIFSHLATASRISDPSYCNMQFEKFTALLESLAHYGLKIPTRHIANSGATLLFPHMQLDMVRPGTAIYGLYPGQELELMENISLYAAMEVKAKLASVKSVPAGTHVSYMGSFVTKHPSLLGVVPLGYVDGVCRSLANRGVVLIHEGRCPMVGNICMDQFVVDLTDVECPQVGDEVVLIGRQGKARITAGEFGRLAGTISIEVLCGLGKRMPMIFTDDCPHS